MRYAVICFTEARRVVSKQATRRNLFVVVTLRIFCFHIFKIFMKAREETSQNV